MRYYNTYLHILNEGAEDLPAVGDRVNPIGDTELVAKVVEIGAISDLIEVYDESGAMSDAVAEDPNMELQRGVAIEWENVTHSNAFENQHALYAAEDFWVFFELVDDSTVEESDIGSGQSPDYDPEKRLNEGYYETTYPEMVKLGFDFYPGCRNDVIKHAIEELGVPLDEIIAKFSDNDVIIAVNRSLQVGGFYANDD